jgi:hypothetical protein
VTNQASLRKSKRETTETVIETQSDLGSEFKVPKKVSKAGAGLLSAGTYKPNQSISSA